MNKMKLVVAGVAMLGSTAAYAGTTANVGVVSEYLFRGIETSGGAAAQGGIDYVSAGGGYAGTWASNTGGPAAAGGTELDFYGGFTFKLGDLGVDLGAIYYYFPEDEEDLGAKFSYPEIYAKLGLGPVAFQAYYSSDYLGDGNEAAADAAGKDTDFLYLNLVGNFPLSDTLTLSLQAGQSSGDGAEVAWGDEYTDYSVSLAKTLDNGMAFSFGLYGTTLDAGEGFGTVPADDDGLKAVVGLKKSFDL